MFGRNSGRACEITDDEGPRGEQPVLGAGASRFLG
jgi:hypothetical protein